MQPKEKRKDDQMASESLRFKGKNIPGHLYFMGALIQFFQLDFFPLKGHFIRILVHHY